MKIIDVPNVLEHFYTFAGEIPWSDTFNAVGIQELVIRLFIESKNVHAKNRNSSKNGWFSNEGLEKTIPVIMTVNENNWEDYHSEISPGRNISIPARELAEPFGLFMGLPTWNMYDLDNNLASISIVSGSLWTTGQRFCYFRKDLIDQFLKENNMNLIWILSGERALSIEQGDDRAIFNKVKPTHRTYEKVYFYK